MAGQDAQDQDSLLALPGLAGRLPVRERHRLAAPATRPQPVHATQVNGDTIEVRAGTGADG